MVGILRNRIVRCIESATRRGGVAALGCLAIGTSSAALAQPGEPGSVGAGTRILSRELITEATGSPTYDPAQRNVADPPDLQPRHRRVPMNVLARDVGAGLTDPRYMTFYVPAGKRPSAEAARAGAGFEDIRDIETLELASPQTRGSWWFVPMSLLVPEYAKVAGVQEPEPKPPTPPEALFGERLKQRIRDPAARERSTAFDKD